MNSVNIFRHLITLLLVAFFSAPGFGQADKAEQDLQAIMTQHNGVGLSVAVVKKGEIIYTHSFGWKYLESRTPLADQDIFRIASISKSFSATSIMQLAEAK